MATTITTTIPEAQKEIIIQSLKNLEAQMDIFRKLNTQETEDNFLANDIHVLKSLFKYKIDVILTEDEHKIFTFENKIDFPEWS